MRVALVIVTLSFLKICGSEAPPMPTGLPGATPGMPGAVPGPMGQVPGMPIAMPGMPTVPGMPAMPGMPPVGPTPVVAPPGAVPAVPATPTQVTEVVAGPHQGTMLTTASAKFEIAVAPSGEVKVYVTDAAGAALAPTDVSIPMVMFEGSTGMSVVVLQPGEGCLQGTATPVPAADARVRFDATVRGTPLPGITATLVAAAASAPTPEATAEVAAPTPAVPEAPPPTQPAKQGTTKRPPTGAASNPPGRRGPPQAQTFTPQPLGPNRAPVRGNVSGSNNAPRPVQTQPGPRGVTVTPGPGVR